jgi:hypothetical protein
MLSKVRIGHALAFVLLGIITISIVAIAQTPNSSGPIVRYTATSANVSGAPDSVRIDVLSWSSDADRDQLVGAWNLTVIPGAGRGGAAPAGRGGGGGRGTGAGAGAGGGGGRGAGGGRGDAPPAAGGDAQAAAPAAGGDAPAAAAAGGGAGRGGAGGGRGGGGGRGRGGDAPAAPEAPPTPEGALATALQGAKTVGYFWTSESAGYSLRYAYRIKQPDNSERIILATERRLGAWNDQWKATGAAASAGTNNYEFSVIELRLTAAGAGEGKASVTGKIAVDAATKSIALDGYTALPVVLKDVKLKK